MGQGLRKPTRTAWLRQPAPVHKANEVTEVLEVGEQLRAAR